MLLATHDFLLETAFETITGNLHHVGDATRHWQRIINVIYPIYISYE